MFNFLDTGFLKNDEILLRLNRTADCNPERNWLPAYYFAICSADGKTELGSCDLRIGYNDNTYYGGNIGYTIFPPHRGQHYAGKACLLLFELARRHGMSYAIITCAPENTASAKTCLYAGCALETVADLPPEQEMYREGRRRVCIYRAAL